MATEPCQTTYDVFVYDRGGEQRRFKLAKISRVQFNRVRDDISNATLTLTIEQCVEQAAKLDQIEPIRHELVIFRAGVREWEGPITLITETRRGLTITAKDVMYHVYKTVMHAKYSNAYPNVTFVTTRAKNILIAELARKEALTPAYNIVPHIVEHHTATDAKTSAVTNPYQYRVQEHIDGLAANSGLDYTVLGRAIHLWDTHKALGYGPDATEGDFLGDIIVSRYGSELTTRSIVTDGRGNKGIAGGNDAYYGEVEDLHTAYDESDGGTPPTSAEMVSQAQRNLVGHNPVPTIVRVPDSSTLNPKGKLKPEFLVPGTYFNLRAKLLVKTYSQTQKLDSVRFEATARGETIQVTMSPAAGTDEPEE